MPGDNSFKIGNRAEELEPLSNLQAALGFTCTLIAGSLLIFSGESRDANAIERLVEPLLAMGVYAGLLFYWRKRIDIEQAGDSFYYLGFLFTMISLAAAMSKFALHPDENLTTTVALGSLGIALTSTIFGLCGRIICGHFGQTKDMRIAKAKSDIAAQTEAIASELRETYKVINEMRSTAEASLDVAIEGSGKNFQDMMEDITKELRNSFAIATEQMQSGFDEATASIEQTATEARKAIDQVSGQSARRATKALDIMSEKLENMRGPDEAVANVVMDLFSPIEGKLEALGTSLDTLSGKTAGFTENIEPGRKALSESITVLREITAQAKNLSNFASQVNSLHSEITSNLSTSLETTNINKAAMEKTLAEVEDLRSKIAAGVDDASIATLGVIEALDKRLRQARDATRDRR